MQSNRHTQKPTHFTFPTSHPPYTKKQGSNKSNKYTNNKIDTQPNNQIQPNNNTITTYNNQPNQRKPAELKKHQGTYRAHRVSQRVRDSLSADSCP